ncbi:hypothetical protein E9993_02235 [Labilibacter sediminis]|nr:hypothetical protein E9993_02235 [Labilibacter sediminis]
MTTKKLFLAFIVSLFFVSIHAQVDEKDPFEKMNKKYEATMQRMNRDYEQNTKRMQREYDARLKKMNDAFKNYLKGGFTEVEQQEEVEKVVEVPKPIDQPKYIPMEVDEPSKELADIPEPVAPKIELTDAPAYSIAPILKTPDGIEKYRQVIGIDFFGTTVRLSLDSRMNALSLKEVSPEAFAGYWGSFTKTYYQVYIESVVQYASEKNLNDWGIYQLIDKTAKGIYTSVNDQELWKWAMLNQAGYQAKIGYNANKVSLMLPFMQEVYEKPYYQIGGYNYYLMSDKLKGKSIYTYEKDFGGAIKKVDLHLPYALNFNEKDNIVLKKTLLPGEEKPLVLSLDKTTMAFLASYPQTDNSVYLNAAMSGKVKDELYAHVKPHIQGKSETEAVTYLLNYLHNSFEYKTDRDQFGKEKMFFPDEIFYYPYSDCEDRTVLFTRMVNDLLGLDVVALTYFSHMAAAVAFNDEVEGYSFLVAGKQYTITDPTYINAPIGSVMPDYEGYTPIAIRINNNSQLNNVWQMIAKSVEQNNEGNIFIGDRMIAENGKYIVSGWFNDEVVIGNKSYYASNGTRDLWFATFNNQGAMEWFLPVKCSNYGFVQAFNVGKKANVYALVNYAGSVNINGRELCRSDNPAHLILGISNKAQSILSENIDFEVPEGKKLAFYGKYRSDGTKVDLLSFPTDKVRFDSKITVDSNNEVVVRGIVGEIEGLTKEVPINLSSSTFSAEGQIESYMSDFQSQGISRHMIPVFATIKLLSQNGGSFSGLTVRNLIRKNNPEFPKTNPKVYEGLLRMQFVANKGGVVKVETYKGKKVSLFSMRIENNSNMQIVKNSADMYTLNFLNGVSVGKAIVWYDLNSVLLKHNGSMVFDYDDDHTKKDVNIAEIVK